MITLPSGWNQNRIMLVISLVVAAAALIALGNGGVLPLDPVNFLFFSFVAFLFTLYRPGWGFLFLVGLVPLETVNLVPAEWGLALRPYQWLSLILFFAIVLKTLAGKLSFPLPQPRWFDWMLLMVPFGGFLAVLHAADPHTALKQAFITLSFGIVYAVARVFWQSAFDVRQSVPFFLAGSAVVGIYALWQNVRFIAGAESFEVMAGRPNATFSEADWLGMFAIAVLSALSVLAYRSIASESHESPRMAARLGQWSVSASLTFSFVVLIITVARSAWLGTIAALGVIFLVIAYRSSRRITLMFSGLVGASALLALFLVFVFHLTPFDLSNRAGSTASGLQKITIACEQDSTLPILPEKIHDTGELAAFHCRHIMLEEIESEQAAGRFISTIDRDDPNISIRASIYGMVWSEIRQHPFSGIGWGSIASVLGTDERGAGLNASNVFLEVWLGSGLLGLFAFVTFWFASGIAALKEALSDTVSARQELAMFALAAWAGITVFDLFNSGILLGFFFLLLALLALMLEKRNTD